MVYQNFDSFKCFWTWNVEFKGRDWKDRIIQLVSIFHANNATLKKLRESIIEVQSKLKFSQALLILHLLLVSIRHDPQTIFPCLFSWHTLMLVSYCYQTGGVLIHFPLLMGLLWIQLFEKPVEQNNDRFQRIAKAKKYSLHNSQTARGFVLRLAGCAHRPNAAARFNFFVLRKKLIDGSKAFLIFVNVIAVFTVICEFHFWKFQFTISNCSNVDGLISMKINSPCDSLL